MKSHKTTECYVVLGHLMDSRGVLNNESKLRVLKLIELINDKSYQKIFFCGWDYRKDCDLSIAEALNLFFTQFSNKTHEIFLSDASRDTVGDAIFLKKNYSNEIPSKINLITSNYHGERTNLIFSYVFDDKNIEIHEADIQFEESLIEHETNSIKAFKETFKDAKKGDFKNIYDTLLKKHPYYNGIVHEKIVNN